jgi:hypothetical protein
MTPHEHACLCGALRCLVQAQLAHWAAPVSAREELDSAAHWQAQALHWLAELVPPATLALHLRPIGGRLPSDARWVDARGQEQAA